MDEAVLILAILFNKITFCPSLNNFINSFKSNIITTNFSTITFFQIIEVANSYWFEHLHHFLLTNNHSPH